MLKFILTTRRKCCLLFTPALLLLIAMPLSAQRQAELWHFGILSGIDFRKQPPTAIQNSRIYSLEACASYSHPQTGELLLYTDGFRVWRRDNTAMTSSSSWLSGNPQNWPVSLSTTQGALVLPHPGEAELLYVFNPGNGTNPAPAAESQRLHSELSYTLVDMSRQDGMGEIVAHKALTPGIAMSEKLSGTAACGDEGLSYWIVTTELHSNALYAFRFTMNGVVESPVISRTGPIHQSGNHGVGQLKISPDGRMIAMVNWRSPDGQLLLYHFDRQSGRVFDPIEVKLKDLFLNPYGLSFSPDSKRLYVADIDGILYQFSVADFQGPAIRASAVQLSSLNDLGFGQLQIAPDRRIYIGRKSGDRLARINFPNRAGRACELVEHQLVMTGGSGGVPSAVNLGLPNFMDHIFTGETSPCNSPRADFSVATICQGQSAVLEDRSSNGPAEWRWQFEGGMPSKWEGREPPPVRYEAAGHFRITLEVSNANGRDRATKAIEVLPAPALDAGDDGRICPGDALPLQASGSGRFHWEPSDGLSADTIANPIASPTRTTEYVVSLRDEHGCESRDTLLVHVGAPRLQVGGTQTICAGETLRLEARGALRYEWEPREGLTNPQAANPLAKPAQTTSYRVTAYDEFGCSTSASVLVRVLEAPLPQVNGEQRICPGDSARLIAGGGIRYEWQPVDGLNDPGSASPTAAPRRTTLYRVTVFNEAGCGSSATVRVVVDAGAIGGVRSSRLTICADEAAQLEAFGGDRYEWSPAEGLSATDIPNPLAAPRHSRQYTVLITKGECTAEQRVDVSVLPPPALRVSSDTLVCQGAAALLQATGGQAYEWHPTTGLDDPHLAAPTASPLKSTVYTVRTENAAGCVSSASVLVEVRPRGSLTLTLPDTIVTPGEEILLPIELHAPADHVPLRIERLRFDLRYDARPLALRAVEGASLLERRLDGDEEVITLEARDILLREAPASVMYLRVIALIAQVPATEIQIETLEATFASTSCLAAEAEEGRFAIHAYCLGYNVGFAPRLQLQVQPNPARDQVSVRIRPARDGQLLLRLVNPLGRTMRVAGAVAKAEVTRHFDLATADLPAGLYYLLAENGGQLLRAKLLLR